MEDLRKHPLGAPAHLYFCDVFSVHIRGPRVDDIVTPPVREGLLTILPHMLEVPHLLFLTSTSFISFPFTQQRRNLEHIDRRQGELGKHMLEVKWVTASRRENGAEAGGPAHHSFVDPLIPKVLGYMSISDCTTWFRMSLAEYSYPVSWFKLDTAITSSDLCLSVSSGNAVKAQCEHTRTSLPRETNISALSAETWVTNN